jgi:hypothetical protein
VAQERLPVVLERPVGVGPALLVVWAAWMEAQPPPVIVGQAVAPGTIAVAEAPLVIVDTHAVEERATNVVAAAGAARTTDQRDCGPSVGTLDTGAVEDRATIVVAAPPGSPPVKTREGSSLLVTLTGEQFDRESKGGMIRDRELEYWDDEIQIRTA